MQIGALWQELYRSQYFEGGRVLTAAISGIDIALHDLKARRAGVPYLHPSDPTVQLDLLGSARVVA